MVRYCIYMSTQQTTYSDTFWNSADPDAITHGTTVYAGSTVEADFDSAEGVFIPCVYTDEAGVQWFKHLPVASFA